jgi:transposase
VTSSYFEGQDNELADYGYNRDGKRGKKQIVVGCLTDAQGRPVSIQVFRGNTSDPKTVKAQIDKVRDDFGIAQVTFVGDRGMSKRAQIADLQATSFHHITAITTPQIEALIRQGVIQFTLLEDRLAEVEHEAQCDGLRHNPVRAAEIAQTREEKWQRLLPLVEEKHTYLQAHPRAKPETALKPLQQSMQKRKISEWVKLELPHRAIAVTKDNEHLAEISRLDGCYVIKTDLPLVSASNETVPQRYKDLAHVEGAFRTMKTALLEMRGLFVRKETRTRAPVFIVMLAYLLADALKTAWQDLDITIAEGLAVLSDINAIELVFPNDWRCQTIPTGCDSK